MVSSLHESVVFLIRDHPVLAAELLKSTSGIEVPTCADAELNDPSFTEAEAAIAATRALAVLPDEQKLAYAAMLLGALSDEARKVFEMHLKSLELLKDPNFPTYYRGQAEGEAKGRAEGRAEEKPRAVPSPSSRSSRSVA